MRHFLFIFSLLYFNPQSFTQTLFYLPYNFSSCRGRKKMNDHHTCIECSSIHSNKHVGWASAFLFYQAASKKPLMFYFCPRLVPYSTCKPIIRRMILNWWVNSGGANSVKASCKLYLASDMIKIDFIWRIRWQHT